MSDQTLRLGDGLPELTWGETGGEGSIVLPTWRGFQSRQGPYGGRDSHQPSDGTVQLSIDIDPDSSDPVAPSAAQLAACRYLVEHEREVTDAVLAAVLATCPDRMTFIPVDADDLRTFIGLAIVHILPVERDGVAYVGFELGCVWDEEHGHGVVLHRGQVIATGQADAAFDRHVAEAHAEAPAPGPWQPRPRPHVQRWRRFPSDELIPSPPYSSGTALILLWFATPLLATIASFILSWRVGAGMAIGDVGAAVVAWYFFRILDSKRGWPWSLADKTALSTFAGTFVGAPPLIALLVLGGEAALGAGAVVLWLAAPVLVPFAMTAYCVGRTYRRLNAALATAAPVAAIVKARCVKDATARDVAARLLAHDRGREAIELMERTVATANRYAHLAVWVDVALQLDDVDEAERAWRRCVRDQPVLPTDRELAAIVDARTTLAHGETARALALPEAITPGAYGVRIPKALVRADALVVAGRPDEARAILDQLRERDGEAVLVWLARQRRPCAKLVAPRPGGD